MDKQNGATTSSRKDEHIKICLEKDVQFDNRSNGFKYLELYPSLLIKYHPDDIDLSSTILGKKIDYPVLISGMTGGSSQGKKYNEVFAKICSEFNIGMGVGSQRAAIELPTLSNTFKVRHIASDIPLIANLGIAQFLSGYGIKEAETAVNMIDADALAIHINPMQELLQKEGDKNLVRILPKLSEITNQFSTPIIIKGVGTGLSKDDAELLSSLNIYAIDVAGVGGTNWSKIESYRNPELKHISSEFLNWGINTGLSIANTEIGTKGSNIKIIASGGIWSGMDAVKSFLVGADYVALALPILKAAAKGGIEELRKFLTSYIFEMKTTMAMIGAENIEILKKRRHKFIGREYILSD
ncbi:MAG: type 2 isopentenyl-diphosphate Delta-isomerase [Candidatus Heimdallarchaeota archaeon]|nr:type 2 isopentenyl-diphosphate Delta-isomerase [Candidatus Heimdallarchaeota archaeon]MCK4954815.1 type 2 isopentenyl-diphosphate Delta-isomerase [Candidatus Heimdallarchaeota archaeon]